MATLRRAGEGDLQRVYELICELESSGDERMELSAFTPVFLRNINDSNVTYLLAEENSAAIGFGSMHVQWLLHHGGPVAEVQELVVTAGYQSRGIGVQLLEALEAEAARRGCLQVELCCNQKRVASNEFYGRRGYLKSHFKHTKKFAEAK